MTLERIDTAVTANLSAYGDVLPSSSHQPPPLPPSRGSVSQWAIDTLTSDPGPCAPVPDAIDDPVVGDDSALGLYLLYEIHYRGLQGVSDEWEWQPELLAARAELERRFLDRLREAVPMPETPDDIAEALRRRTEPSDGPSLSKFCEHEADWDQLREIFVHRTAWQTKEADPHSWALPRLGGRPKAALAEIQSGEYGDGVERDVHQNLYGLTLSLVGLDPTYGAYIERLPGVTLSTVNLVSLFGLHRTLLPAMVGHLAGFEMSSVEPMSAYSAALRRLGAPQDACHFFDTHVVADAHHQQVAADDLAAGLVEQDPSAAALILWGVDTLGWTEGQFSEHVQSAWERGESSLLKPLKPSPAPAADGELAASA